MWRPGRQAAQHAEVADDDDGRRSGAGPERVAGLRHDTELIGDGQEAVADDVLRRAAVDADRDPGGRLVGRSPGRTRAAQPPSLRSTAAAPRPNTKRRATGRAPGVRLDRTGAS